MTSDDIIAFGLAIAPNMGEFPIIGLMVPYCWFAAKVGTGEDVREAS
jgi:hypothetical protein